MNFHVRAGFHESKERCPTKKSGPCFSSWEKGFDRDRCCCPQREDKRNMLSEQSHILTFRQNGHEPRTWDDVANSGFSVIQPLLWFLLRCPCFVQLSPTATHLSCFLGPASCWHHESAVIGFIHHQLMPRRRKSLLHSFPRVPLGVCSVRGTRNATL